MKKFLFALLAIAIALPAVSSAAPLRDKLAGKLLLQVEQGGRIWYVAPSDTKRYEITFKNALPLFEKHALGISNENLNKIPIDASSLSATKDSDNDGNTDQTEAKNGYDPFGPGKMATYTTFGKRFSGKLLLQVESGGRIWYVDFNGRRWEVTWDNLMTLFKKLSLGITNVDLEKIPTDSSESSSSEYVNTEEDYADTSTDSTPATTQPVTQTNTVTAPVTGSKQALLRILNENGNLQPTEIVQLYQALAPQERTWLDLKTKFTNFMQLLACQEHPDFVTYDYTGTTYTCTTIAQNYAQALQYSTNEQIVAAADVERLDILNRFNCENGTHSSDLCSFADNVADNMRAGDYETNQQIINNINGTCRVGIDPGCTY